MRGRNVGINTIKPGIQMDECAGFFYGAGGKSLLLLAMPFINFPLCQIPLVSSPFWQRPLLTSPFGKGGLRGILVRDTVTFFRLIVFKRYLSSVVP